MLATDSGFFCEAIRIVYRSKHDDKSSEKPTEEEANRARNVYRLLSEWAVIPGTRPDGSIDSEELNAWLDKVKGKAEESGHLEVALNQIGRMLTHAPEDEEGLWIHHSIAEALDAKGSKEMRSGFVTALFNQRGVHSYTAGKEELKLARKYRARAEALEEHGYSRFATAMREFAQEYERQGAREADRDPFDL